MIARLPRMLPRSNAEQHRASTPLELLFDLVFVVAVSLASQNLHHAEGGDHLGMGVVAYLMVFFAIWWAWMNFTWFASAYDTDDWLYRITTIAQMGGALTLAAGVPRAMEPGHQDFTIAVIGYSIMRVALISQWLRAARSDPEHRSACGRYALGLTIVQLLWVGFLFVPHELQLATFIAFAVLDVLVPVWAEAATTTTWHRGHIVERYGLFTLIVLGESILASGNSVIEALAETQHLASLVLLAITGIVIVAGCWWIYFALPQDELVGSQRRTALFWGYSHLFIFASVAAVSAGIEVAIDAITSDGVPPGGAGSVTAAATLSVPVAVFLALVWLIIVRPQSGRATNVALPIIAVLVAASALAPYSMQVTAVLLVVAVLAISPRGPLKHAASPESPAAGEAA